MALAGSDESCAARHQDHFASLLQLNTPTMFISKNLLQAGTRPLQLNNFQYQRRAARPLSIIGTI
jgi:hypothetical protein